MSTTPRPSWTMSTTPRPLGTLALAIVVALALVGCASKAEPEKETLCYASAEELETVLNSGEDVTDAMVTFTAGITSPGPNGYVLYAGKKLAFISANHPNIEPGSTVTVRIKTFKDVEGVWNIEYEK